MSYESDEARKRKADMLYEKLDYNNDRESFQEVLDEVVSLIGPMSDPTETRAYRKIRYLSRESDYDWKKAACDDALISLG